MKKTLLLLLALVMAAFVSCSGKKTDIMEPKTESTEELSDLEARVDALREEKPEVVVRDVEKKEVDEEDVEPEEPEDEEPVAYDGPNFITMDKPTNGATFTKVPIIFEGIVSPNTTKIVVAAEGAAPCVAAGNCDAFYNDVYKLRDFKYGDDSFAYRAKVEWGNLIGGENNYEFKAYFDDGKTATANLKIIYKSNVSLADSKFDGCVKDVTQYAGHSWYSSLKAAVPDNEYGDISFPKNVREACYASNSGTVILIANSEYMYNGEVYRFNTGAGGSGGFKLEQAKLVNGTVNAVTFTGFGKRSGNIVPLEAKFGDAGTVGEAFYDYNFVSNELVLKRSRFGGYDYDDRTKNEELKWDPWTYY